MDMAMDMADPYVNGISHGHKIQLHCHNLYHMSISCLEMFIAEPGSDMETEVPTPAKRARKGAALTPAEERAVRLEKRKAAARS